MPSSLKRLYRAEWRSWTSLLHDRVAIRYVSENDKEHSRSQQSRLSADFPAATSLMKFWELTFIVGRSLTLGHVVQVAIRCSLAI